ncbi:M15 family metallopeptidase [Lysinibacillus sp. CD3-6]|uniref:M15 family metallopeptidase n=1 Tax=Lysinibacillus sp. CD3-6 TaxID=2892541 RepID=UPI00116B2DBF|nr:M15 family metallopeptidase [Lysinibacillus sp. CD3-6]UED78350.1 M15 family metallopeptidase [Lysinibacillus sp. CD3-6]
MSVTTTCRNLGELLPVAQTACRVLFQQCYKAGIKDIFITETYRSQARQNYLYQQGRTRPGKIVTWTLSSNHTSRLAWDIAVAPPKPLYDVDTLTKVGAIARKLGITWGGDWARRIDRPHFEVKRNWKMPRGYKLEGQVLVPSNSKMKVQLIVKDKREEINVANTTWNPGSPAMRTETENFIAQAVKEGIINASHLKDLQSGTMTTDRLIGLYITIQQRRATK